MSKIYLEPVAMLYASAAKEALASGAALPLAGGPIAFGAVRIWEGEPGGMTRAIARTVTLQSIDDQAVIEGLQRLIAPRPAICGVTMDRPRLMGIVNVTPDSFSDGGDFENADAAVAHAIALTEGGADILDIGGESTRPGAQTISPEDEIARILPVVSKLSGKSLPPISIDTRKPEVMRAAVEAGATMVNDVSGLTFSSGSFAEVARLQKPVIIMHGGRDPKTMAESAVYRDVIIEVYNFLETQIDAAVQAGLPRELILADPGLGFAKTLDHNVALMQSLAIFHGLAVPIVVGTSRKSMIRALSGETDAKDRIFGSVAATLHAAKMGVQMHRVHDVKAARQALSVQNGLQGMG